MPEQDRRQPENGADGDEIAADPADATVVRVGRPLATSEVRPEQRRTRHGREPGQHRQTREAQSLLAPRPREEGHERHQRVADLVLDLAQAVRRIDRHQERAEHDRRP